MKRQWLMVGSFLCQERVLPRSSPGRRAHTRGWGGGGERLQSSEHLNVLAAERLSSYTNSSGMDVHSASAPSPQVRLCI